MNPHSQRLVSLSASEVKRIGGTEPTLIHLAEAVRRTWSSAFAESFSEADQQALARLVQRRHWVGDAVATRAMIEASQDIPALVVALHQALSPHLIDAPEPEPASTPAATHPDDAPMLSGVPQADSDIPPAFRDSALAAPVAEQTVIGREATLYRLASALMATRKRPVLLTGAPGAGLSFTLGGITALLRHGGDERPVLRVGLTELTGQPEQRWKRVLDGITAPSVLCLDDMDHLARLNTRIPNLEFLTQVANTATNRNVQLVLCCSDRAFDALANLFGQLTDDSARITLPPLDGDPLAEVVACHIPDLAAAHDVTFTDVAIKAACTPPRHDDYRAHPGLALDRLDQAAARARLKGTSNVTADLVDTTAQDAPSLSTGRLATDLAARVKGQDRAIATIADRLAITTAGLDLRPERPDAVLLFVGPTGVGKTELARSLAEVLCGTDDNLIRLDMSEYAHESTITRLTGPAPGYIGSDNPDSWLTTRVAERPHSVVLLDEIEKAHPQVWNTFLQAFDYGRLTDAQGHSVDLSRVVFILTSNLGVQQANRSAVGFGQAPGEALANDELTKRVMTAVKDAMPPELLNRLDDIIVFNQLGPDDIRVIAQLELDRITAKLAARGRVVQYTPEVLEFLATTGYDPGFGARHLHRNIERHLLGAIARTSATAISITVSGDTLKAS